MLRLHCPKRRNVRSPHIQDRNALDALARAELKAIDLAGGYREVARAALNELHTLQRRCDRQSDTIRRLTKEIRDYISQ